jgi:hypothetical protein
MAVMPDDFTKADLKNAYHKLIRNCQSRRLQLVIMPTRYEQPDQDMQQTIKEVANDVCAEDEDENAVILISIGNTDYSYAMLGVSNDADFNNIEEPLLKTFEADQEIVRQSYPPATPTNSIRIG